MPILESKLRELILWEPHPKQKEILECGSRDIDISAGRRFGKSQLAAYMALKELLDPVGNKNIWIVAPTYDLSKRVFDPLVKWFLKLHPNQSKCVSYRPIPCIRNVNGSFVEGKSIENPAGLLGQELDLLIMDEAARVPRNIWESHLAPSLTTRRGKSIKISTPFGKNWFWEDWLRAKATGGAFTFKTFDNPYWHQEHDKCGDVCEEWERIKGSYPERVISQEFLALFEESAIVFRGVKDIIGEPLADVKLGRYYVMGLDLGKYRDWTVVTIVDRKTHDVVYWDRFQGPWELQKTRIAAVARRYNSRIIMDSTGLGDPIMEELQRMGVVVDGYRLTHVSKQQLIEKLASFVEQKAITIPSRQELVDELEAFGYEYDHETGKVFYGAPSGIYDDCVISLALAVWGLDSPQRTHKFDSIKDWRNGKIERMFGPKPLIKVRGFEYA